jgi:hypothetical protein
MPTDLSEVRQWNLGKTGLTVACTLNVLVVCSVLAAIPLAMHDREFNPFFLMAFFRQMAAVGAVSAGFVIVDLALNARRSRGMGKRVAALGILLSLAPLPVGLIVLRIVAALLGWQLE